MGRGSQRGNKSQAANKNRRTAIGQKQRSTKALNTSRSGRRRRKPE
jgi:hypothetical protein